MWILFVLMTTQLIGNGFIIPAGPLRKSTIFKTSANSGYKWKIK